MFFKCLAYKLKSNSIFSKKKYTAAVSDNLFAKIAILVKQTLSPRQNYNDMMAAIENRQVIGRHPLNLQIQTVSSCNGSCYFCPYPESWHKHNPGSMSKKVFSEIINEVSQYQIAKFCPYFENEPLLDPKLFDRIEYAISKLDFKVLELATNASVLDKQKIDNIVSLFPSVRNQIWISFHGIDKDSFESIMGLDFETCKANVLALIEKAQNHNINILICGSGMPRISNDKMPSWFNKKQFYTFWKKEFKKHGLKKLPYLDFFSYHDRAGQIKRNEVSYCNTIRPNLKGFYCLRVDQWAHFLYTGELLLCCMDYKRQTVFGDIKKMGLNEIYNSEKFISIVRQTAGKECSSDNFICKKCVSPGG